MLTLALLQNYLQIIVFIFSLFSRRLSQTQTQSDCTDTRVVLINSAGFWGWGTGERSLISIVFQKITWNTQFANGSN